MATLTRLATAGPPRPVPPAWHWPVARRSGNVIAKWAETTPRTCWCAAAGAPMLEELARRLAAEIDSEPACRAFLSGCAAGEMAGA